VLNALDITARSSNVYSLYNERDCVLRGSPLGQGHEHYTDIVFQPLLSRQQKHILIQFAFHKLKLSYFVLYLPGYMLAQQALHSSPLI